ncbi:pantothenate kinase 1-like isoform X2 [Quercus lobata]|uniref:pantothenate kinase 1-like isoform X2 n=1 Tax=Quercus lobata TaxID=97700 RepID=UPI001243D3E5|nr:pantothenate kinase 1-like isoform X2 [Quercus lobata]
MEGQKEFVQIDHNDLFPYLLVNIGSGGSMIKVDGDGKFQWVSGTNVGGGTYWGLGRLLTKCKSFDELLELSQRGDNRTIDMLVGDIYSGMDYSKIGLSASTIASSFGKAIRLYCTNALEGPPKETKVSSHKTLQQVVLLGPTQILMCTSHFFQDFVCSMMLLAQSTDSFKRKSLIFSEV